MRWESLTVPGRAALDRRVRHACDVRHFGTRDSVLGDWVMSGDNQAPAIVAKARAGLVDYLDSASDVGRRFGTQVGSVVGAIALIVIVAVRLMWTILR